MSAAFFDVPTRRFRAVAHYWRNLLLKVLLSVRHRKLSSMVRITMGYIAFYRLPRCGQCIRTALGERKTGDNQTIDHYSQLFIRVTI